jgi:hypothetical protein
MAANDRQIKFFEFLKAREKTNKPESCLRKLN